MNTTCVMMIYQAEELNPSRFADDVGLLIGSASV